MAENDNINLEITEAIVEAVSPTAAVSKDGDTATITVTDKNGTTTASVKDGDKGDKGDQGDKGDKGDKGDTGNTGATGATPELTIGTVTTLDPTDPATATITGTDEQPVLSLGIPKGVKGDTGNAGAAAGFGTVSASVDATVGTPAVSVTPSGPDTAKNFAFAFHNLKGVKGDTGATGNGIASIEETATSGSVHTYTITYTNGNTTTFDVTDGEVTNASLATILEDYARTNGAYEEMTVGDAEQLVSTRYVNDAEPYNFRTTGGSADVGNRKYLDKIVGGTVAWNQLVKGRSGGDNGVTASVGDDGAFTLDGTASGSYSRIFSNYTPIVGHRYIYLSKVLANPNSVENVQWGFLNASMSGSAPAMGENIIRNIITSTGNSFGIRITSGVNYTGYKFLANIIDLTQMFGSTIADYIYSLETANAGAGVAFFRKLFPKDYYPYNAGQLMSVKTSAHNTVGFNQWDEEWEVGTIDNATGQPVSGSTTIRSKNYISVVGGQSYYVKCGTTWAQVFAYDSNKNFITTWGSDGANPKTIPSNARYLKFRTSTTYGTTYNHDICINLSWSGYRNGEYEPYEKHEYALDSDLELRGIPKLDSANNLYYDGDTYEYDGTVNRRYGIVDLGTRNWNLIPDSNGLFYASISGLERHNGNAICSKYWLSNASSDYIPDKSCSLNIGANETFWVKDTAYSDKNAFKTAMDGVYLVYELATPTTEEADPFQQIQICDDFGTEEFVDTRTIPVPVGHETRYPANLRDKLQHLPDLADADGYYMIQQSNNDMSLIRFRIPQAPAEDGEYTLKATVSGGTPTYAWESTESEGE